MPIKVNSMIHDLKIKSEYLSHVVSGVKSFELRKDAGDAREPAYTSIVVTGQRDGVS